MARKTAKKKTKRRKIGFAALSPKQRKELGRRGGQIAHQKGVAHTFSKDEAAAAGRKSTRKKEKP